MRSCSISHQSRTAGKVLGTLIRVSFQNNSSTKESVCVCVCVCVCMLSHSAVSDSVTPWTVAHQPSLSMEFSRQEYWSGGC